MNIFCFNYKNFFNITLNHLRFRGDQRPLNVNLEDKIDLICPSNATGGKNHRSDQLFFKIHLVDERGFRTCSSEGGRRLITCNMPEHEKKYTFYFQEISPSPWALEFEAEKSYYVICELFVVTSSVCYFLLRHLWLVCCYVICDLFVTTSSVSYLLLRHLWLVYCYVICDLFVSTSFMNVSYYVICELIVTQSFVSFAVFVEIYCEKLLSIVHSAVNCDWLGFWQLDF